MKTRMRTFVALAEVVSALAVVVTLVILVMGVRENTAVVRATAAAQSRDALASMNDQDLVLEDDLIAVLLRSTDPSVSLDDFNEIERFKLMSAQRSFFRRAEAQFFRYRNGLLDEDAWQTVRHRVRVNLESPVDRQIWDRDKSSVYTAAFVREIESFAPPR